MNHPPSVVYPLVLAYSPLPSAQPYSYYMVSPRLTKTRGALQKTSDSMSYTFIPSPMNALVTVPGNTATVQRIPIPEPGPNEIRVRVHSVALNPVDALYVAHPADKHFGRVVGSDIAGVVEKLGSGVADSEWKVGDRAAGLLQGATSGNPRPGGFAEYAILEADLAIHVPDALSFDEAATLPMGTLTAAQALFIRLGINPPFANSPYAFPAETLPSPTLLVYSAATSIGLYAIEFAKLLRTPSGAPYRIFATASPKHHSKLLALGVEAVFDYRSKTWENEALRASGGIAYAFDCISEDDTTARISQTFREGGGTIAVVRKAAWNREGVREDVKPLYGAAWMGLGHEILYNNEIIPASPEWRAFTVALFKFLSSQRDVMVKPNPVRIMPGGLERIVGDGFRLLGAGKVGEREEAGSEEWMRPISGEKLVYHVAQ